MKNEFWENWDLGQIWGNLCKLDKMEVGMYFSILLVKECRLTLSEDKPSVII